ncbi:MAG: glycosyltransferase family 39 protein [Planctomycetota bacterium]
MPGAAGSIEHGPSSPRFRRRLFWVLAVAVIARIAIVAYAERHPQRFDFPDSHRYVQVALNIAAGEGPIESEEIKSGTDPLYPLLLSTGLLLGLDDSASLMCFGRIVNSLFGLACVFLLALLGRRLVGERAAIIAAAILAVDPILLFFNTLVLTETCYTFLLLAAVLCIVRVAGSDRPFAWAASAGVCMGLGTLMRSSSLFMPLALLPLVWCLLPRGRRGRAWATLLFLLASFAPLAPTVARNYRLLGAFVPVRTGSGASLMEALGPWADGSPGMDRIEYPAFPHGANEHERDRLCRRAAIEWARAHPGDVLRLALAKLKRTWSVTINADAYSTTSYKLVAWGTIAPEFLLAIAGLCLMRRRRGVLALLLVPAIYFTLLHMVFVGSVRYRVPAMPLLFVPAGVAAERLCRRVGDGKDG